MLWFSETHAQLVSFLSCTKVVSDTQQPTCLERSIYTNWISSFETLKKIHIIPNTLFVKVFSVLPRRAMSGVTGLHYSENNYDLQRRLLSTVTGTTVILENCVSLGLEEASGRDRSFYRLLFQKRFWFVIKTWWRRHKVTNTHRKFRSCSRWIQVTCLQLTDTSQTSSDGQILTTRSTPWFHCFLKASLKESIIKTYQRTN